MKRVIITMKTMMIGEDKICFFLSFYIFERGKLLSSRDIFNDYPMY